MTEPELHGSRDRPETPSERAESRAPSPVVRSLDRAQCEVILARNHLGRMAYSFGNRVDIAPLHYVYHDGWIYGRTSLGSKLVALRHSRWVAFEVDEVRGPFEWESVVVHGAFYILEEEGSDLELAARREALALLRDLTPAALTDDDPAPHRTVLFRIYVDEVTGRAATPRSSRG
jgi:nitroimidazol reductase NimA-like FMN-containing flavoprotein (pyridoxamine 5'-phosphate oxidase superfamily)